MTDLLASQHWQEIAGSYLTFWLVSTAIHSLPAPKEGERWYGAFYGFLQAVSANWGTLRAGKMPTPQEPPRS